METIAAALSEQRDTIEEAIEPYLIQIGLLQRTSRGRMVTDSTFEHLGLPKPKIRMLNQNSLFDQEN